MAYRVTNHTSYGSRILNSFVGVLVGIALIIGMSVLLFYNEGRFNLSELAQEAQAITEENATLDGQLVWYSGTLEGEIMSFDDMILDNNHLQLSRSTEVYAWIESSHQETTDNMGGSQDTDTYYTYALGWTSDPKNPAEFEDPEYKDKTYAVLTISNNTYLNDNVTTEHFEVDMSSLVVPGLRSLNLSESNVDSTQLNEEILINDNYIYYKANTESTGPSSPSINDVRVSYSYIPSSIDGILLGKAQGDSILPYSNEDGSIYRFFDASTLEEVVEILDSEHTMTTWILRIVGTLLMCIGFAMLTGPFSTLLMVVPFLGKASGFILGLVSFLVGLIYSFIVIVISAIFHNPIALVIAIAIILMLVIMGYKKKKKAKQS